MKSLVEGIQEAHRGIRPQVPVSVLERSAALSQRFGVEVWLKCEHLQPTGSFKIRGATNKIRLLAPDARRNGVVTASTGNHGRAVAHAGRAANVSVTAFAAGTAPQHKLEAIRSLGAKLVTVEGDPLEVEQRARAHAQAVGLPYISPYNDVEVVAGQGTIGMELLEQLPNMDAVFVSVVSHRAAPVPEGRSAGAVDLERIWVHTLRSTAGTRSACPWCHEPVQ
jgi:threonine dehydratase